MSNAPTAVKEPEYYVDVSDVQDGYVKDLCRVQYDSTGRRSKSSWFVHLSKMASETWNRHNAKDFDEAANLLRGEA